MKLPFSIFGLFTLVSVALGAPKNPVIQDRISDAEFNARHAKAVLPYAALEGAGMKAVESEKSEQDEVADLLARSAFLTDGRQCTILPAGAVIHVPKNREDRVVKSAPSLPLVTWEDFLRANASWIREFAIDSDQATGAKPFDPKAAQALGSSGSIVISTYIRQPVAPVAGVKTAFAKALEAAK
ncbi:MAG: hypothetical protein ACKO2G_12860 [Verrucomicrobiales bacterium]